MAAEELGQGMGPSGDEREIVLKITQTQLRGKHRDGAENLLLPGPLELKVQTSGTACGSASTPQVRSLCHGRGCGRDRGCGEPVSPDPLG